jgi:outer membrane protein, multidrug efflux system
MISNSARSVWGFVFSVLGGLVTVGCAGLSHRAHTTEPPLPPPPAAAQWQAPLPGSRAAQPAPVQPQAQSPSEPLPAQVDLTTWWARFNDPQLTALVAASQANSADAAAAQARLQRARAARVAAAAAGAPQLSVGGNASVGRNGTAPSTSSVSVGGQAGWEWDLFGAVAAGQRSADARVVQAQAALHGVRLAVAVETATSYTELRACQAQAQQAGLDLASRQETARLTGLSADAGFTAPADAALARAGAAQSRSNRLQIEGQCELLIKALVEATDAHEPDLRRDLAVGTAQLPRPSAVVVDSLPAGLLTRRPDLTQAAMAVAAAAADSTQAQARQRPQVSVAGRLGLFGLRAGGESSRGLSWTLGPLEVTFPVFDGGTRAATVQAAAASYQEAVAAYRAQMRRAVREVESNLVTLQTTATREQDATSAATDLALSLRATQARQRGGLASLFELESARRDAVAAQGALIELNKQRVLAWIGLFSALGGGFNTAQLDVANASPGTTLRAAATTPP